MSTVWGLERYLTSLRAASPWPCETVFSATTSAMTRCRCFVCVSPAPPGLFGGGGVESMLRLNMYPHHTTRPHTWPLSRGFAKAEEEEGGGEEVQRFRERESDVL